MGNSTDVRVALQGIRAFIVYRLEQQVSGKLDKIPVSPLHGGNIDPHNPHEWLTPEEAGMWADLLNSQTGTQIYGVGVVISEHIVLPNGRRLFCLDIDKCRDGDRWAPHAAAFLEKLPGCGREVSVSYNGLHAYGTYAGARPEHGTRNKTYGLELYTRLRFIAVTGAGACGDPLKDLTAELHALARDYFPPHDDAEYGDELTTKPVPEWSGPTDDAELIRRAMAMQTPRSIFGGKASFADLWLANEPVLARTFPPQQHGSYDASAADLALANWLAFLTGNHGERMDRLMRQSKLVRSKWERPGYLLSTIQRACASQSQWYKGAPSLQPTEPLPQSPQLPPLQPSTETPAPLPQSPQIPDIPLRSIQEQIQLFEGCVYVEDIYQILMPDGRTLNAERFDAFFSGYEFVVTQDNSKVAKRAWEAFVHSQVHRFPKVRGLIFDPKIPSKAIVTKENLPYINSYVPASIVRRRGDISPYLTHLYKLLPHGNDAQILLSYFAACVQHLGDKFQWWPLIQGVEGNGKSTLSFFLEYAIGERYTHWPKASELGSKFNSAFYGKLLVCCEDVHITEARGSMWEALKPMITAPRLEIEAKGIDKVTREVCFNGVMNSNHKNAIRKTVNERRVCPFFCAQQNKADLVRDGMDEDYFMNLRAWRLGEGREIVADYLLNYEIPDKWNPATRCQVAPDTTATKEAINAGMGVAEQEIIEAIGQGMPGFKNGWLSSTALDRLLASIGKSGALARNKRRELVEAMGYRLHPGLVQGRTTTFDTDGTRPYLFILPGTPGFEAVDPAAVLALYQTAQKP